MSFDEVRFPVTISRSAVGGPERMTEVVTLRSGFEERNSTWADSRRRYDAGYGVKRLNDLYEVIEFFEARRGKHRGFRWKDWADYKSCAPETGTTNADQAIGTGNGVDDTFQLAKVYSPASHPYTRAVAKPVQGTVKVSVNGVARTEGAHYTVNYETGRITFLAGETPAAGHAVKAGFEFDVAVRFDTDRLDVNLDTFFAGAIPQIPLVEVRV